MLWAGLDAAWICLRGNLPAGLQDHLARPLSAQIGGNYSRESWCRGIPGDRPRRPIPVQDWACHVRKIRLPSQINRQLSVNLWTEAEVGRL